MEDQKTCHHCKSSFDTFDIIILKNGHSYHKACIVLKLVRLSEAQAL